MYSNLKQKSGSSLIGEYSTLLSDAVLRQRARAAEHNARIEAEISQRVKSEFIANMSHELRTPLNTVIGFSKLMSEHDQRRLPDAEIVQYANLINDAATHLLSVINDILDITKMQAGRYSLDAREIDVSDVVEQVVESLELSASQTNLTLTFSRDANLEMVRGDADKLGQVFFNLINNAIKFTPAGGKITVECLRRANNGTCVLVRDTGIGMKASDIDVALTPFGQVDAGKARWREGTGLGLSIARALVDLHGGQLRVRSEKGHGTEVAVLLPPKNEVSIAEGRELILGNGAK